MLNETDPDLLDERRGAVVDEGDELVGLGLFVVGQEASRSD
mgnify:CR=1 FL=1